MQEKYVWWGFQIAFLDEVASVLQIFTIKKPLLLFNFVITGNGQRSVISCYLSRPFGEIFLSCGFPNVPLHFYVEPVVWALVECEINGSRGFSGFFCAQVWCPRIRPGIPEGQGACGISGALVGA